MHLCGDSPVSLCIGPAGGIGSFTVTDPANCGWQASNASGEQPHFLTVSLVQSGPFSSLRQAGRAPGRCVLGRAQCLRKTPQLSDGRHQTIPRWTREAARPGPTSMAMAPAISACSGRRRARGSCKAPRTLAGGPATSVAGDYDGDGNDGQGRVPAVQRRRGYPDPTVARSNHVSVGLEPAICRCRATTTATGPPTSRSSARLAARSVVHPGQGGSFVLGTRSVFDDDYDGDGKTDLAVFADDRPSGISPVPRAALRRSRPCSLASAVTATSPSRAISTATERPIWQSFGPAAARSGYSWSPAVPASDPSPPEPPGMCRWRLTPFPTTAVMSSSCSGRRLAAGSARTPAPEEPSTRPRWGRRATFPLRRVRASRTSTRPTSTATAAAT